MSEDTPVETVTDDTRRPSGAPAPAVLDPSFEALLRHLKESRGFDFTGYKRTSLMRRVDRQMQLAGVEDYADYRDFLEIHPDEFRARCGGTPRRRRRRAACARRSER